MEDYLGAAVITVDSYTSISPFFRTNKWKYSYNTCNSGNFERDGTIYSCIAEGGEYGDYMMISSPSDSL